MARPFHYHVYDHPNFDDATKVDGDGATEIAVFINEFKHHGIKEKKRFYSLKRDLVKLRAEASDAKILTDASSTLGSGKTERGRDLQLIKLGLGSAHKVLILGCHHAREWISVEVPYLLAEFLVHNFKQSPETPQEKRIKHLLTNREIWIVPMVNPDGHAHTIDFNRFWRPNRHQLVVTQEFTIPVAKRKERTITVKPGTYEGVDLNRNYASQNWGEETYDAAGTIETSRDPNDGGLDNGVWCGESPGSEAETQLVTAAMQAQRFESMLTFHNFSETWVAPNTIEGDPLLEDQFAGVEQLVNQTPHKYQFKLSRDFEYETTGDVTDLYVEAVGQRPCYTPELRPANSAPVRRWFSGLPEGEINPTFKENLPAILAVINSAPFAKPAAKVSVTVDDKNPAAQVVRNHWRVFMGFK